MSIVWYKSTKFPGTGYTPFNSYIYKTSKPSIISNPYTYNGVKYGTKQNPLYKVQWDYHDVSHGSYSHKNVSITNEINLNNVEYNNFQVVGVIDGDFTEDLVSSVYTTGEFGENRLLSGKWRTKDVWVGVDNYGGSFLIPLLHSVILNDGSIYTNDVSGNTNTDYESTYFNIGGLQIGSSSTTYTLPTNYKNMVVDFGSIEQDVPKFYYDFITTNFTYIYQNIYTIKSTTGETVAQVTEQPPIKKTNLQWAGNAFQLSITGTNDVVQTLTWEDTVPQGYTFVGLSTSPNGALVIPLGESDISIESSTTFYPVFRPYKVPPTLFQIELYKNTAEANRVDKTDYLEYIRSIGGVMREASSVTDMTITLQLNEYPNFNYVKIPILKRYYFVNDITLINANLYELDLEVDPLMSYKEAILGLTAFVDRNEFLSNPRIIDKKRVIEQGVDVEEKLTANQLFNLLYDDGDYMFVLNGYKFKTRIGYINLEGA